MRGKPILLFPGAGDLIRRVGKRPVLQAGDVPGYGPIFNPGAVFHDGRYHLFARGIRDGYRLNSGPGARFLDYISDILVFVSDDGISYRFQKVLAESSPDNVWCYEDARVAPVVSDGVERWVMTYTNLPNPESGQYWRIGIHELEYADGAFSLDEGSGDVVGPNGEPDKDGLIFNLSDGRVALIHRIFPNMQLAIFDSLEQLRNPPTGYWEEHMADLERHTILTAGEKALGIGAGAPPVKTDDGLLLLYHERGSDGHYRTKAALLDEETAQVKSHLSGAIMQPELRWERSGDVDNVVFVQGAILQPDGMIYTTYGAADRCIGVARVDTGKLLSALRAAA